MERRVPPCAVIVFVAAVLNAGCTSVSTVRTKVEGIRARHGVTVRADDPLSRCYLSGNLPGLLDRIDRDLARTPSFFKRNIGPVIIEESFLDNLATYPLPFLVRGYVNSREDEEGFPIHIKNRSLAEKVLLFAPRDGELFLHEASHSFEFNVATRRRDVWLAFLKEFEDAGGPPHLPPYVGALAYAAAVSSIPPIGYLRVRGMPSLYGWLDHFEDFAETHCYLARHGGDVDFLRESDPVLFRKCMAVQKLCNGWVSDEAAGAEARRNGEEGWYAREGSNPQPTAP